MQPFNVSEASRVFNKPYISSTDLKNSIHKLTDYEYKGILNQWVSEGIPYAFKDNPLLFESIRLWFANHLNIEAKEITLIGSARLGFSLNPNYFGKKFGDHSDLDFVIISSRLFNECKEDFDLWKTDFEENRITPTSKEEVYWKANKVGVVENIKRGFIDSNKIPNRINRYPTNSKINDLCWRIYKKMEVTDAAPKIRKATVRIYNSWPSFMNQLHINFSYLIKEIAPF